MNTKYSRQLLFRFLSVSAVLLLAFSPFGGALAKESATYAINTTDDVDDGVCNKAHCSLREAINTANDHPGADRIEFKIRGNPPFTIQPLSALPEITDPVTIDGTTQAGFHGTPIIELDGTYAGEVVGSLVILAGDSTVKGLVINRFYPGDGIVLTTNGGNTIEGNFLGTDVTGTVALSNYRGILVIGGSSSNFIGGNLISGNWAAGIRLSDEGTDRNEVKGNLIGTDLSGMFRLGNGAYGIRITEGASHNLIGGTEPGARNLISGNWDSGVYIDIEDVEVTRGNIVQGNYIGTDVSGAAALPNAGAGVAIDSGASNTHIGGADEGAGNLISGNDFDGISIGDSGTTGTVVQGNFIGTDASGIAALQNGADGIRILGGASHTLIGGTEDGARNVISGNTYIGVSIWDAGTSDNIVQGNYIGTDESGTVALQNGTEGVAIYTGASNTLIGGTQDGAGNVISGNGGPGVKIADPGTTGNKLQGNLIGTDASGTAALPNMNGGVFVCCEASKTLIGGTQIGARNVISGNIYDGVKFEYPGTSDNIVQGNYIGTDLTGTQPLGNSAPGVDLAYGASDNLISGNLISGNLSDGVKIVDSGTTRNTVQGNLIGTDVTGMAALGNNSKGVNVEGGASGNLIGGTESNAGNLISGNGDAGILLGGTGTEGNQVQGNFIGTDLTGTSPLGNVFGIGVSGGAANNVIGGTEDGAGNVISGNLWWGVLIYGDGVTGNLVQGNFIGTDASGTMDLGHLGSGVYIGGGAADNLIGGTGSGAGNTIAFNGVDDAWAGIALDPSAGSGNTLLSNSVYSNKGLGIDLNNDTLVTPNDALDQDSGPNDLQNFPVITAVRRVGGAVMLHGTLESTPSTKFRLEFFSNVECDPSGNGEGQAFLGSAHVKTDQAGFWNFIITLPVTLPQGAYVTATATDPGGSTSEFSNCFGP